MTLYIEHPKDATRKLLGLINEFGKVAGYKIKTQKSLVFPYAWDVRSEKEIKETISFTIASKRIKYIGIQLPKEAKYLYSENHKILKKEIKDYTNREIYPVLRWKNKYENDHATQSHLYIQCNTYQIPMVFFHRIRTKNFTIYMEIQ